MDRPVLQLAPHFRKKDLHLFQLPLQRASEQTDGQTFQAFLIL